MSKKTKGTILFFVIWISIIVLAWIGINALDGDSHYDSSLCTICHQNKKIANADYCYSCYQKAQQKVEEKNKNCTSSGVKPDPVKPSSNTSNSKTTNSFSKTTSGSSSSSSYSKTTSSSSSKKEYNTLNYDPDDYDDPDDYAEDAWDEDFDDYDEAYDFWEDW
ncbi:MAG: hypothetical protein J6X97_09110 [Lachnospiraceae bacterium]|nr:hypothetical protein [Lachnospiraceae bacterium]